MRWIAAVILILGLVAAAGIWLDEPDLPDVVWDDGSPYCPHCRSDVNWYATVCYSCRYPFIWKPHQIPCDLCLSQEDADWQRACLEDDLDPFRANLSDACRELALPPDVVAAVIPEFIQWVKNLDAGECVFCAGTGRWVAPAMTQTMAAPNDPVLMVAVEELDGKCPVCTGHGKCIGCGGDRKRAEADEAAKRGMAEAYAQLTELEPQRSVESAREYYRIARAAMERATGTVELFDSSALYSLEHEQADWAINRLDLIRGALPEEDD